VPTDTSLPGLHIERIEIFDFSLGWVGSVRSALAQSSSAWPLLAVDNTKAAAAATVRANDTKDLIDMVGYLQKTHEPTTTAALLSRLGILSAGGGVQKASYNVLSVN
jgi:hypothetical protein